MIIISLSLSLLFQNIFYPSVVNVLYFSFKILQTFLRCFYYQSYLEHEINLTLISHDVTDFSYTQAN